MESVRVKVYGLLSLTRRGYLTLQTIGLILLPSLIALTVWLPRPAPPQGIDPSWVHHALNFLLDALPWLLGATLLIEIVETLVVLRRFKRKEQEQPPTPTPPPAGAATP